ncbi:MAG: DUF1707 SHOCT-like domain-containing protein [Streptosporangiaceae bacterium]
MTEGFNVRVGDADRDAVAAQLRDHYADGRLTLDELNERLDQTFGAKTKNDLTTVMRDLPYTPRTAGLPSGSYSNTAWQGPQGPGSSAGSDWQSGAGSDRRWGPFAAFAPMMALVWVFLILGAVMMFGIGGGDRPFAIVLIIAALAFLKRLFGGRRRGMGGPRRGSRGPRGPRGPRF